MRIFLFFSLAGYNEPDADGVKVAIHDEFSFDSYLGDLH